MEKNKGRRKDTDANTASNEHASHEVLALIKDGMGSSCTVQTTEPAKELKSELLKVFAVGHYTWRL